MQAIASAGLVPVSASSLPSFALLRPASVADAVAALQDHERAVPMAGGSDLVAAFNEGLAPGLLIDLARIDTLRCIEHRGGELRIGATVTHASGCADALVLRHAPGLAAAWRRIANPRIRFTGTLGGNLMALRRRYEGSVLISALGAALEFATPDGVARFMPADLWRGAMPAHALLQAIVVPSESLLWYGYERSMRPLMTIAAAVRQGADGLHLRCAVATEYLEPLVLERTLPVRRLTDLRAVARAEATALMAEIPDSFADPVLNARYARAAGAPLLARQLVVAANGAAHG